MINFDQKFIITEDILNKCKLFAQNSVKTSLDKYARRNQFDGEKIIKDIQNGKIGEEAAHEKLLKFYPDLSNPDYFIYDKKDKSWNHDLVESISGTHIAVKSQNIDSAIAFSDSWVFQYNDNKSYDCDTGIFKTVDPNHYVTFVSLNVPKRSGIVRAFVKVQWLHDKKLFKEMKKQSLRGNKLAVYLNDLEQFKDELFQL